MRPNGSPRTDRPATRTHAPAAGPGHEPARTTAGLVAATLVPATVVAAAFAPLTTAAVAAALLLVGSTVTALSRTGGPGPRAEESPDPPVGPEPTAGE